MTAATWKGGTRRACATGAICAAMLLTASPSTFAKPDAPPTCPPGYDLGVMTVDDALVLYAGYFTEQEIRDGFAFHDVNANGIVCRKHPPAFDLARFLPLNLLLDDLSERAH